MLAKDCPDHAIIIEDSELPESQEFFDAWELHDGIVSVNFAKAQTQYLAQYNAKAIQEAQKRQLNTLAGLPNNPDDATWQAKLASDRASIEAATTTTELLGV